MLTVAGIIWQVIILKKVPNRNQANQNSLDILRKYISFYYKHFISSIFVGALSNSLFIFIGSLYYLYFKYQKIPHFSINDIVVMGIGLALSFVIGAIVQLKHNKFHIIQLEKSLKEIEENTISEESIEKYKSRKLKNIIIIAFSILAGLLLLIFFIYKFM